MREIKFRAWYDDEETGEKGMLYVGDDKGTSHPLDCCVYAVQGQPVTLMQYTGIKDKDGKDIYEGDLLALSSSLMNFTGQVVFDRGSFLFKSTSSHFAPPLYEIYYKEFEIIGNIHDNPELLKDL